MKRRITLVILNIIGLGFLWFQLAYVPPALSAQQKLNFLNLGKTIPLMHQQMIYLSCKWRISNSAFKFT